MKEVWLIHNPMKQSEWVEIPCYSIPVDKDGMVEWDDCAKYPRHRVNVNNGIWREACG